MFDVYYKSRGALWGGCYPRPSVEMIEKDWKLSLYYLLKEVSGIKVYLDPDMDYSNYPVVM